MFCATRHVRLDVVRDASRTVEQTGHYVRVKRVSPQERRSQRHATHERGGLPRERHS